MSAPMNSSMNTGHHGHASPLPRGLLYAMAGLVVASLLGVTAVRLSGVQVRAPDANTVVSRSLQFKDGADGSVIVIDAKSGQEVLRDTGEGGFLRGSLRVMSRERRMRGLGPEAPFELLGRADGRLTLVDTATQVRIEIESFGPTNAGAFARLLAVAPIAPKGKTP